MRRPVSITTPYPTPEKVARTYKISSRRAKELREIIEESIATSVILHKNERGSSLSKNGAARRGTKSGSVSRRKLKRGKAKSSH